MKLTSLWPLAAFAMPMLGPFPSGKVESAYVANVAAMAQSTRPGWSAHQASGEFAQAVLPTPITVPHLIVTPPMTWDWGTPSTGTLDPNLSDLADYLPGAVATGQEYSRSSVRFSDGYRALLAMVEPNSFPAADQLELARQLAAHPTHPTSQGNAPGGWAVINRAGTDRWAPIWQASETPSDWLNKVKSGEISNSGCFALDLDKRAASLVKNGNGDGLGSTSDHLGALSLVAAPTFENVVVCAHAWGQAQISPGDWFSSSMFALARGFITDKEIFFGPQGVLRARVSGFFVAYKPQFHFFGADMPSPADALPRAGDLQVFGIPVQPIASGQDTLKPGSLTLEARSPSPVIVAVAIETFF